MSFIIRDGHIQRPSNTAAITAYLIDGTKKAEEAGLGEEADANSEAKAPVQTGRRTPLP